MLVPFEFQEKFTEFFFQEALKITKVIYPHPTLDGIEIWNCILIEDILIIKYFDVTCT